MPVLNDQGDHFIFETLQWEYVYALYFVTWAHAYRVRSLSYLVTLWHDDIAILHNKDVFWNVKRLREIDVFPRINEYDEHLNFLWNMILYQKYYLFTVVWIFEVALNKRNKLPIF